MEHQERKREIQLREKRQLDITSRQSTREKVQERESKRGEMGRDKERGETEIKICTECTEERLQRDPPF